MSSPPPRRPLGHPLHPATVHLPLGLLLSLPVWDVAAWCRPDGPWWTIGFWVGAAGAAAALLAIVTGLIDLLAVPPRAMLVAFAHLAAMGVAVVVAAVSVAGLHGHAALPAAAHPRAALIADAVMAGLLVGGGWLGGHLVYRHRVGIGASPPGAEDA